MASPEWNATANGADSFGNDGRAVTPNDAGALDPIAKAVCVGSIAGGSNLAIKTVKGTTINFVGVAVGFIPPYRVQQVLSTGTTCTVYTID